MSVFGLISLVTIVVISTSEDLLSHRISNVVVASGLVLGLSSQFFANGSPGLLQGLSGMALGLLILLPCYVMRVMGAGDVKLMGAVGSFLGPDLAVTAGMCTLMAGGALGLALIAGHHLMRLIEGRSPRYALLNELGLASPPENIRKQRFPYAGAIALGTVAALLIKGELDPLVTAFGGG